MSEYPRPELNAPREHSGDRTWGSIICIFSALSLFGNATWAFDGGPMDGVRLVALLQCGLLAVRFAGGVGVLGGRRWGFILVALVSSVYVLLNLFSLANRGSHLGLISLLISAYIVFYCIKRLMGRDGPAPV